MTRPSANSRVQLSRAEIFHARSEAGDENAFGDAARYSTKIILNGKSFEPAEPVPGVELLDLLEAHMSRVGNSVRFEFDDDSWIESRVTSVSNPGTPNEGFAAWVTCGVRDTVADALPTEGPVQ